MKNNFLLPSQAQIKKWARLKDTGARFSEGIFLAEGIKVVEELLSSTWLIESILVLPEKIKSWEKLIKGIPPNIPIYGLNPAMWNKISQDKAPEGIMAITSRPQEQSLAAYFFCATGNILILHEINNPNNLGALLRSALWFGFSNIILSANSVDYTNPKAIRTSMGSVFHLTIVSGVDLIAALPQIKESHYLVVSDVQNGLPPHPLPKKVALLLGSESHGLPEYLLKQAAERWSIPGNAIADSLSLPQAAAIMMYECAKNRR